MECEEWFCHVTVHHRSPLHLGYFTNWLPCFWDGWPKGWRRCSPTEIRTQPLMTEHLQMLRKIFNPWSTSTRRSALCPVSHRSCQQYTMPIWHNLHALFFCLAGALEVLQSAGKMVISLGVPVVCVQPIQQGWLQELNCWNARKVLRNLIQ